jgi:hypothetical protein
MSGNGWLQFHKQVTFTPFSCVSVFTEYLVSICVYIHVCITHVNRIKYFTNIILKKTNLSNTNTTKFMYTKLACYDLLIPRFSKIKQIVHSDCHTQRTQCMFQTQKAVTSVSSALCRCLVWSVYVTIL